MGQWIFVKTQSVEEVNYGDGPEEFILENEEEWPVNTEEEMEIAKRKMTEAGMSQAEIWEDFGSEENYEKTNLILFV